VEAPNEKPYRAYKNAHPEKIPDGRMLGVFVGQLQTESSLDLVDVVQLLPREELDLRRDGTG
jgi:hypothetical protein